jgi:hypothetical protein
MVLGRLPDPEALQAEVARRRAAALDAEAPEGSAA